jgi:hypothetical protein
MGGHNFARYGINGDRVCCFFNLLNTQTKICDGYTRLQCVTTTKVLTLTLDGAL